MLKDRFFQNGNFFYVSKEKSDTEKQLFYKFFSLEDDIEDLEGLRPLNYWDPRAEQDSRVALEMNRYILLVEKEGERISEKDWFYAESGDAGKGLEITRKKAKKYGKNAYMITIEWTSEEEAEAINSRYIYLYHTGKKEKLYFLQELIAPLDPYGKKRMDQYIFELPETDSPDDYKIQVEPIVKKQYQVEIDE